MKKPDNPEILNWSRDVAKLAGIEVLVLEKKTPLTSLPELLILLTVITSLTLVSSAAYYIATNSPYAVEIEGSTGPLQTASISSPAEIIVKSGGGESTTTTTTTEEPTTTTTSTTTTTMCGFDGQPPCETAAGTFKCKPGNKEGAEGLCHQVTCAPTVNSGNMDGQCGAFALDYCRNDD